MNRIFGPINIVLANFALLAKLRIAWKVSRKNLILGYFLSPCFAPPPCPPGYVVPMECVDLQQRINVKAALTQPEKDTASSGYLAYFWEGKMKALVFT